MTTKIAICGSACVGKSTLMKALAKELNVEGIDEHYDTLFAEGGHYLQPDKRLIQAIFNLLEQKQQLEQQAGAFITDRCPIDLFNLWLSRGFAKYQKETDQLQIQCRQYLKHYSHVVFLPWGVFPLEQLSQADDNRKRTMNPWIQFQNHSTMIGLAQQWLPPERLLAIPYGIKNLHDRVQLIRQQYA